MPTTVDFPMTGGVNAVTGYGDQWLFSFSGTWAFGDKWTLTSSYQGVALVLGEGQVTSHGQPTYCFTFTNRVYLANGQYVNFSDNSNVTAWETQNAGAGFISYLSQLGQQDSVSAFGQLQGRLAIFGSQSVQLWTVDADPTKFALNQQLGNTGTQDPLSVQNLGDFDVLYLDSIGVRSLRTLQVTLNAYVDDIGSAIDNFVQDSLAVYTPGTACAIVEPTTKNYWLFVNDTIYVLSRHPGSKITAWTTYEPRGNDNNLFVPQKFVQYKNRVWCRATNNNLYLYGDVSNQTYDPNSQVTFTSPYLEDKRPGMFKQAQGFSFIFAGQWTIKASMNPKAAIVDTVLDHAGSATTPDSLADSTFDIGNTAYTEHGTHFAITATSSNQSTSLPAVFSSLIFYYNKAETP